MASTSMKDAAPHKILKDFAGSQTGNDHHFFMKGDIALLTPHLAEVAVAAGQAEPASPKEAANAEARETKVTGPGENQAFDIAALDAKGLVKFAKDNLGLKLKEKDGKEALLAAIEEATKKEAA